MKRSGRWKLAKELNKYTYQRYGSYLLHSGKGLHALGWVFGAYLLLVEVRNSDVAETSISTITENSHNFPQWLLYMLYRFWKQNPGENSRLASVSPNWDSRLCKSHLLKSARTAERFELLDQVIAFQSVLASDERSSSIPSIRRRPRP